MIPGVLIGVRISIVAIGTWVGLKFKYVMKRVNCTCLRTVRLQSHKVEAMISYNMILMRCIYNACYMVADHNYNYTTIR